MPATKDEIAERFWRHVEHYGFAKTSVEEVARELGISKTTVYQHFSSKDDIFRYVVRNQAEQEVARVEQEYATLPSYGDRFEKLVRERVLQSTRDWFDQYGETELRHQFEFGRRVYGEVYDTLVQRWAAEGAEAGEFHLITGDVLLTARCIGSILQYAIAQTHADRGMQIDDAVVEAVRKLLA
jgi:AcrR family transcriptional regulator